MNQTPVIETMNARLLIRQTSELDSQDRPKVELYGVLLKVNEEALARLGTDDNLIDCEILIRPRRIYTRFLPAPGASIFTLVSYYQAQAGKVEQWGKVEAW